MEWVGALHCRLHSHFNLFSFSTLSVIPTSPPLLPSSAPLLLPSYLMLSILSILPILSILFTYTTILFVLFFDEQPQMKNAGIVVEVDDMVNTTLDPPTLPLAYLDQFKDIGMKGYLDSQVDCNQVVRAWLCQWKKIHMTMWARTDATTAPLTEQHYRRFIPAEMNAHVFKLFVHDVEGSGSGSSSRGRGGGGGGGGAGGFQITEYNGKRSRYAPNAPPSTSSQDVPAYGNSGLLDSGGGGRTSLSGGPS
jgi:hypothetical protein